MQHNAFSQAVSDSFRLMADTRRRLERIAEEAKSTVLQFHKDPASMRAFIENHGTPVVILEAGWMGPLEIQLRLKWLGLEPGFIPASPDARYQRLSRWLCEQDLGLTPERLVHGVFLLTPDTNTVSFLSHQVHHWMACRAGLKGYSEKAQRLYQTFWEKHRGEVTPELLKKLTVEEITELRSAIHRDMEALSFLRRMIDEVFVPANQAEQLKKDLNR